MDDEPDNRLSDNPPLPMAAIVVEDLGDPDKAKMRTGMARTWLSEHSGAEALAKIGWQTFPEKIAILGALHEARGGDPGWRSSDIDTLFKAARETPPGNFARDISNAIKSGIVSPVTPRTYQISKTGWLKLYDGIVQSSVPERFKSGVELPPGAPEMFSSEGMPEL
jgi:hypothetical protein